MTQPDIPDCAKSFVTLAERLADAVRPVIQIYFRAGVEIEIKEDATPVTAADREAEAAMREIIAEVYPDHGILGEEFGALNTDAEYVWVLDPIDGTKSFVTGKPLFGTLIGLTWREIPILGIIDQPVLKERWVGARGRPTTFNGQPAKVRPSGRLQDAWLYATSPDMFGDGKEREAFERLRKSVRHTIYGADCYAYGLLASGFVDLIAEADLKPFDFTALVPVVEGAGGRITDWRGHGLTISSDGQVLAAGDPQCHAKALDTLSRS